MARISSLFMLCYSLTLSKFVLAQNDNEIKYAGMVVEFPQFETAAKYSIFRDTVHFYYQGNLVLYGFPYLYETFKNDVSIAHGNAFNFLIAERNRQKSLYFKSLNDTVQCKWLPKDSVLDSRNIKSRNFHEILTYDSLINSAITSDSELIEKYIPFNAYKGKFIDTTYLCYSASLTDIPYSLSPKLDSMHSWKLSKVKLVYNSFYHPEMKATVPMQVWTYSVFQQKLPKSNLKEMTNFFQVAKKLFNANQEPFNTNYHGVLIKKD